MGHITADDAKWLASVAIFAALVWSVAFLVLAVRPGNPRGARHKKADRQPAWRAKGYGKQKRALSPLAFVAMVFPSLIAIIWYALPRRVRSGLVDENVLTAINWLDKAPTLLEQARGRALPEHSAAFTAAIRVLRV